MKKVCFPVVKDEGLKSEVYEHFGSAPLFLVADRETNQIEPLINKDLHHQHGQCNPMKALGNNKVDAVVVGGIGGGALRGLQSQGIKVFKAQSGTVKENLEYLNSGRLVELSIDQTCGFHQGHIHHIGGKKQGHDCCS